jgi:hypothetical protein
MMLSYNEWAERMVCLGSKEQETRLWEMTQWSAFAIVELREGFADRDLGDPGVIALFRLGVIRPGGFIYSTICVLCVLSFS